MLSLLLLLLLLLLFTSRLLGNQVVPSKPFIYYSEHHRSLLHAMKSYQGVRLTPLDEMLIMLLLLLGAPWFLASNSSIQCR